MSIVKLILTPSDLSDVRPGYNFQEELSKENGSHAQLARIISQDSAIFPDIYKLINLVRVGKDVHIIKGSVLGQEIRVVVDGTSKAHSLSLKSDTLTPKRASAVCSATIGQMFIEGTPIPHIINPFAISYGLEYVPPESIGERYSSEWYRCFLYLVTSSGLNMAAGTSSVHAAAALALCYRKLSDEEFCKLIGLTNNLDPKMTFTECLAARTCDNLETAHFEGVRIMDVVNGVVENSALRENIVAHFKGIKPIVFNLLPKRSQERKFQNSLKTVPTVTTYATSVSIPAPEDTLVSKSSNDTGEVVPKTRIDNPGGSNPITELNDQSTERSRRPQVWFLESKCR